MAPPGKCCQIPNGLLAWSVEDGKTPWAHEAHPAESFPDGFSWTRGGSASATSSRRTLPLMYISRDRLEPLALGAAGALIVVLFVLISMEGFPVHGDVRPKIRSDLQKDPSAGRQHGTRRSRDTIPT